LERTGLHPTAVVSLPPQCAALNMTNVLVQGPAVEASFSGDPELVIQAVALDPLIASVLTLKEIRDMTAEMLKAEARRLPQFAGKKLRPVPAISIPKNVKRRDVPLDPALAIANRFAKLAKAWGGRIHFSRKMRASPASKSRLIGILSCRFDPHSFDSVAAGPPCRHLP
jgi:alpha-galactosidase